MKKSVFSLILGASLMVSSSALALTAMTDSNMKDATGQAGVSIALDDVTLYQSIGQTIYTDTDGLSVAEGGDGKAAGVFITGSETLTTIRAIFAGEGDRGGFLAHNYDVVSAMNGGGVINAKPLTIDVTNKAKLMTAGKSYNVAQYIDTHTGTVEMLGTDNTVIDGMDALAEELQEKGIRKVFNIAASSQLSSYKTKLIGLIAMHNLKDPLTLTNQEIATYSGQAQAIITAATDAATDTDKIFSDTWEDDMDTILDDLRVTDNTIPSTLTVDAIALGIAGAQTWGGYAGTISTNLAVAGVVIGLPTIEIRKTGSLKHIGVTAQTGTANSGNSFISIKKADSTLAILDGYVEICPH